MEFKGDPRNHTNKHEKSQSLFVTVRVDSCDFVDRFINYRERQLRTVPDKCETQSSCLSRYLPFTSNCPVKRMSSDPEPIITLKVPGSITKCICRSHSPRSSRVSTNETVLVSPAFNWIRSKPLRFFSYVVTLVTSSRIYNWTTSSPAREPVLVTLQVIVTFGALADAACGSTFKSL